MGSTGPDSDPSLQKPWPDSSGCTGGANFHCSNSPPAAGVVVVPIVALETQAGWLRSVVPRRFEP